MNHDDLRNAQHHALHWYAEPPDLELATLITSTGFVQPVTDELRIDVRNHLQAGRSVYSLRTVTGKLMGYAVFRTIGEILYLAGIMLSPEVQAQGLARSAVLKARQDTGLNLLGLRTQSLRMWSAGRGMTKLWLPRPPWHEVRHSMSEADDPVTNLVSLGENLAAAVGCQFPMTLGYYGSALYGQKPVHHDARLQSWWDQLCNYERGDAIICIGTL